MIARGRTQPTLVVTLGNQLFPLSRTQAYRSAIWYMAEDLGLCTYVKHHQQKIVLFLAAMRAYADVLRADGRAVRYVKLDDSPPPDQGYEVNLGAAVAATGARRLVLFEVEDRFFEKRIEAFAKDRRLAIVWEPSPMFLTSRKDFAAYLADGRQPMMARFYTWQRKRLKILLDAKGRPVGGKWSFDADNRKALPRDVDLPGNEPARRTAHVNEVIALVRERFRDHPGDARDFWLPTTRDEALRWLDRFLRERFALFGDYEDALSTRDPVLFHSVLTPMLNLGLITPDEVLQRALEHADSHDVPLNALEGFVRQIIGWREFVRGIYQHFDDQQQRTNFWQHHRGLTAHWYRGDTGIQPLDDVIGKALKLGWTHHIERLMVVGNLMTLCEIEPRVAWRWFMQMYVDASDWVMGPNVFGMGIFSDGGIFATKPYICGSNYLVKMSDSYRKSDGWCETVDGLYWRFIDNHRDFFAGNPRLAVMVRALDKLDSKRRDRIFTAAAAFLERCTTERADD